jgi:kumamolisin
LHQNLPEVGFANPALYDFARVPAGLPALAFHQVTEGSNFHFLATAGWNPATGLGTPDAAHLADDFEWYERAKT